MHLLLTSRWLNAVPAFLTTAVAKESPLRIGFIASASAIYPDPAWTDVDRDTLRDFGHQLDEIVPEARSRDDTARQLDTVDALFVSGGNTFHLLHVLRSTGADTLIVERVRAGLPYIGASAGAVVAGPDILPASLVDDPAETAPLESTRGLGLVDVVVIPHADGIVTGREVIDRTRARFADRYPLVFIDDDQALVVSDDARSVVDS